MDARRHSDKVLIPGFCTQRFQIHALYDVDHFVGRKLVTAKVDISIQPSRAYRAVAKSKTRETPTHRWYAKS